MVEKDTHPFQERKSALAQRFNQQLVRIEPVLVYEDGTRQVCNNQLTLKLRDLVSLNGLLGNSKFTTAKDAFVDNQYIVTFEDISTEQLFALVSELNQNKNIEFAEPNFTRFLKPHTTDPFYNSQWAINNQGYLGGYVGADMDVDISWTHTTGQGIKVAIIDDGVDLNHPDLVDNLLAGYDATGNNSHGGSNSSNNDAHGTNCAGIVGAVSNNGIGIAGVAYNAKIIPIRIAYSNGYPLGDERRHWISGDSWIVSGINWAVNNGADVLSCSWGGGSSSTAINNAIDNAVNNGRNINGVKKGCIVLFSSGNNNSGVSYPATRSNVIAVGASSMCDERKTPDSCDGEFWWGSNYGTGIDVVAPGVKIYATDISGSAGYSTGDYYSSFNGTSSACPNAAGVAALILSVNPNFTQTQVRQILESKTTKISGYTYSSNVSGQPNGTWNNEVGYGRINACQAVFGAFEATTTIAGPALVCTTSQFTLNNAPSSATPTWSSGNVNGLSINAITGVATRQNNYNGEVTVSASLNSGCGSVNITRNVWVGAPNVVNANGASTVPLQGNTLYGLSPFPCIFHSVWPSNYYYAEISEENYSKIKGYPSSINFSGLFQSQSPSINGRGLYFAPNVSGNSYNGYIQANAVNQCGSNVVAAAGYGSCSSYSYSVYPNPSTAELTVDIVSNEKSMSNSETIEGIEQDASYEVVMMDQQGTPVYKTKTSSGKLSIDTSKMRKGIYIIHIVNGESREAITVKLE